jgi:protein TonB
MAEQLVINRYREEEEDKSLNWPRIIGIAFVIALHAAALLLLLIPAVAPPAEAPPVEVSEPRPTDVYQPPAPPAPPAPVQDIGASVDISSKNMNPPRYPPSAARAGIEGTVILIIDVDASGNVTNVSVEKSSRNRDLDRAAMEAARKWRFNPSVVNGQKAAGRVRVPVDFKMGG